MRLKLNCPICNKPLDLTSSAKIGDTTINTYKCGHTFVGIETEQSHGELDFTSCDGRKSAFEYQQEDIEKILKTNLNVLDANPMGLGKTIEAIVAARESGKQKILVLVKSSTQYQWIAELKEWYSPALLSSYLIKGSNCWIPPNFNVYVLSMDTLSRLLRSPEGSKQMKDLNFDLVIVDECHSFKDPSSKRSQALVAFLQDISQTDITKDIDISCPMCRERWTEQTTIRINLRGSNSNVAARHYTNCKNCGSRVSVAADHMTLEEGHTTKGLILLSGTPIKNRADEYFVPLNLLRPDVFYSQKSFRSRWLVKDPDGKYRRISPYMIDEFRRVTEPFVIRRERKDVMTLPPFLRSVEYIQPEDENFKKAYNAELDRLEADVERHGTGFSTIEPHMATLRRICGMAKCDAVMEKVTNFLETTEDDKIAIGIWHTAVRDNLYYQLEQAGWKPLKLSGEDSPEQKERTKQRWLNDQSHRVAIINMISGGVGLNLQLPQCQNAIGQEPQWSAADEEQFECRFYGRGAAETQPKSFLIEYMIALNTIDNWVYAIKEEKRQICGETLDGWDLRSDPDGLKQLVERTLAKRL